MMTIVFLVLVSACVFGGFMLEGGPIHAIYSVWQEYIIVFGSGSFIFLAMMPSKILKHIGTYMSGPFVASKYEKDTYTDALKVMYESFVNLKRSGLLSLEKDVSNPEASSIFSKYPSFLGNHHALDFYCDSLKLVINYNSKPEDVEQAMNVELDAHHAEAHIAPGALNRVADAMPAVGIVAAVLGVIIAMAHIDGPPAELGHKVSAALTGTLLGIFTAYGYCQPIAQHIEYLGEDEAQYFQCLKEGLITYLGGAEPMAAVEIARRSIHSYNRPSSLELEEAISGIRPR
ncbi:MAG: MotA/TolQ/ExbB proton channel family protein [Cyanobacteria bacterium]|nr:MotA/TolQ/ExbB proton channel family protein [Cyanobacteriota bacterium]